MVSQPHGKAHAESFHISFVLFLVLLLVNNNHLCRNWNTVASWKQHEIPLGLLDGNSLAYFTYSQRGSVSLMVAFWFKNICSHFPPCWCQWSEPLRTGGTFCITWHIHWLNTVSWRKIIYINCKYDLKCCMCTIIFYFLPPLYLLTLLKDPIYVINVLGECVRFISAYYHFSSTCTFSVSEIRVKQRPLFTVQSIHDGKNQFPCIFCHLTFCFT